MQDIKECHILIIDDELPLLHMVKEILTQEGFQHIYTATSCKEGKSTFEKVNPHLVILDVMLHE